ncbi:hypothetical protein [Clostridium tyrobutyricum]|uniref:hypothetical protein n=1 Tax=Clostridium tyrobutyricum TaxID=1519 RepID=UPI00189E63DE|nr:hypothetical protein [Clostridium tyrobutyricum]
MIAIDTDKNIKEKLIETQNVFGQNNNSSIYYNFYHKKENEKLNHEFKLKLCERLIPILSNELKKSQINGEFSFASPEATACFCIYGQLGVLFCDIPDEKKVASIHQILEKILIN